jgi:hypothetical protein
LAASSAVAQQPADRWKEYVAAFDKGDRAAAPPTGEIVFVGSSTMRQWDVASYVPDSISLTEASTAPSSLAECDTSIGSSSATNHDSWSSTST